jgi:hypothetical protein
MPKTFDSRIQRYEEMIENIEKLKNLEMGSSFQDIDLVSAEKMFREHLAALELGRAIYIQKGVLDVEAELQDARFLVHNLETLRGIHKAESLGDITGRATR